MMSWHASGTVTFLRGSNHQVTQKQLLFNSNCKVAKENWQRLLQDKDAHRRPVAVVGTPVDLDTAVEEGKPAAAEGLAGMLPAAGHTGRYLQGQHK